MTDNPIAEALAAVTTGVVTGVLLPAFNDVFDALEAPPMIKLTMALIPIIEFIAGLGEALVFGFLYSISLIGIGFYLQEWGSVILGVIALGAHLIGILVKGSQ